MNSILYNNLENRVIDISTKYGLSHLSSCLTAVNIIDKIYSKKNERDVFILSSGHAGLALYCVLEKYLNIKAEELLNEHGVHPNKDHKNHIICSTGSLGLGLSIAVGHALADTTRNVYCLISDGECAEGIIWESLAFIKEHSIENIFVYVNCNGFGAYRKIDLDYLKNRLRSFLPRINIVETDLSKFDFLKNDLSSHYCKIK